MSHHAPPAPPPETPPTPETPQPSERPLPDETSKSRGRSALIAAGILVAFIVVYSLSLFGVHLLATSSGPLKAPDLNATDDSVVLIRLEELKTVANRLSVKVLVIPQDNMFNQRLDV